MNPNLRIIKTLSELENKKIAIYGYGVEGKVTHEFLTKFIQNAEIKIFEDSKNQNAIAEIRLYQPDLVIISSGIIRDTFPLPYTTASNIFFSLTKKEQIIAITGSKGKSSTALMLFEILKTKYQEKVRLLNLTNSGNSTYAPPLLQAHIEGVKTDEIFICELSSYQLMDLVFSPHMAILTSLFDEHLSWHMNRKNYFEAKANIVRHQNTNDFFFVHEKTFSKSQWGSFCKSKIIICDQIPQYFQFRSKALCQNAQLACALAQKFDVNSDQIIQGLKNFQPLAHRQEILGVFSGITFVDDGSSSAPQATLDALESFPQTHTLIMGGLDRGYDYQELVDFLPQTKVKVLILFPNTDEKIIRALRSKNAFIHYQILQTSSMTQAIAYAFAHTPKNTTCLLSSGAPSYSLWKNWDEKGKEFLQEIKNHESK